MVLVVGDQPVLGTHHCLFRQEMYERGMVHDIGLDAAKPIHKPGNMHSIRYHRNFQSKTDCCILAWLMACGSAQIGEKQARA